MAIKRYTGAPVRAIRRYFGFSRGETNGFFLLLAMIGGLLALPSLLRPIADVYDPTADQRQLNLLAAELAATRQPRTPRSWPTRRPRQWAPHATVAQVALAPFNPNDLSATDWQARGVPRFVAQRLVRYRDAIGGFTAKTQVQRAYGLDAAVYARLAPYIQLPEQAPPRPRKEWATHAGPPAWKEQPTANTLFPKTASYVRKPRHLVPFDLNAADTAQLQQIRGVGRRLSARVVAYRQRLGGFVREEQVAEIYNLAPDLVDSLRKYTFVRENFAPEPLHINQADLAELRDHPYVGARLGRVLIAYREQHGPFHQPEDLRQIRILEPATLEKLRPYLRFE